MTKPGILSRKLPRLPVLSVDNNPVPIPDEEVLQDHHAEWKKGLRSPKPKVLFEVGETVRVIDGPFLNFSGVVEDVKPDKGKLRVMVSIFGRATRLNSNLCRSKKSNAQAR